MDKPKLMYISFTMIVVIIFDQLLKKLMSLYLTLGESKLIVSNFLSLTLTHNTGAGFGILKGQNTLLIFITIIVIGLILYYFDKIPKNRMIYLSIGLIVGGALGNLIDRIVYGYVIDFIDFNFWPAFNLADSAITMGVILIILFCIKEK